MDSSQLVALTTDIVSIPSHEDETTAGNRIVEWLRTETTATVERDGIGNVFASRGSGDTALALVGHHDVVSPDRGQVDENGSYLVEERDGRIYGRGAADMKGALAAAMYAFRDAEVRADTELVFASFVGEEDGGRGAQYAIDEGFIPDRAIVTEGSTGYSGSGITDVAVAHKGRRAVTIDATGRSAHASEPETGENAIYRATDAISIVREMNAPTVTIAGTEAQGSVAVTEIEGGTDWNVIPSACTVTVDERTVPGKRASLDRVTSIDGVEWTIDQDLPPMICDDPAFRELVCDVADELQNSAPQEVVKPHATDAGWLAEAGTEAVVCGPAEPGEAHTAEESVSIDVLERCYKLYREVATRWNRGSEADK
jgi:acetylornithine deacetylase